MKLEKNPWLAGWIYLAHAALFFLAGFGFGWYADGLAAGVQLGLSLLVWGVILRTVIVWHITWSVNSITHLFGYRNYATNENSRNNWLVALLTVGEGWHNNHHEDPASASVQHRWWEIDITYYEIKLLEKLGLAWDVIPPRHHRRTR
jgi:fatty-acid desaturase